MDFDIPLITKTQTVNITKLKVFIMEVQLFKSARIHVQILDEHSNLVESKMLTIDTQDYQNWVDDNYLMEWIKNKISEQYS